MLLAHHACYRLFLQSAKVCSQHTCIILLHQTDTALTTQQSDTVSSEVTVCRRQQCAYSYDIMRTCIRPEGEQAVTGLWHFCVCNI